MKAVLKYQPKSIFILLYILLSITAIIILLFSVFSRDRADYIMYLFLSCILVLLIIVSIFEFYKIFMIVYLKPHIVLYETSFSFPVKLYQRKYREIYFSSSYDNFVNQVDEDQQVLYLKTNSGSISFRRSFFYTDEYIIFKEYLSARIDKEKNRKFMAKK